MATCVELISYCAERLQAGTYHDVAVNGLQVEGRSEVKRLASAVSASAYTITAAADWGADALLVHHGILWGGSIQPLTGIFGDRVKKLFQHDMNLIAYHLPLDGHDEIGNNVLLANALDMRVSSRFGDAGGVPIGVIAEPDGSLVLPALIEALQGLLDRTPVVVGHPDAASIQRVGILSGSGYGMLGESAQLGCQALITGDVREPTMAEARELGIAAIAAGHEATERLGVQALAAELAGRFDLETRFFHDPNPI